MPRIASLPVDKWDKELCKIMLPDIMSPLERTTIGIFANAPILAKAYFTFFGDFMQGLTLRPRLLELLRLRIAFHNQCRSCMAMRYQSALEDGLTENLVCSLERPQEAPDLTEAEKAVLHFADLFATNHLAISDETIAKFREYYSEQEIVEICMYTAVCVGFGRFAATYTAVEELPESYRDMTTRTAPWGASHSERVIVHM